ncbi:isopeptide-forming domain-containing fimbrial protein [Anaerococcus cruorum]|uniref:isopeptide-forming domain-containing fimbrial protein n=1 Tax=Anaerococcus sp. WGS1529 TaxID=3366812 RepID=UPI00372D3151
MKKATNKLMSFLAAFAMVLSVLVAPFTSANAAEAEANPSKITVNVHKILMSKTAMESHDTDKNYKPSEGIKNIQDFFGDTTAEEIPNVYFVAIKEGEEGFDDFASKTVSEKDAIIKNIPSERKGLTTEKDKLLPLKLDNGTEANPIKYHIYEVKHLTTYKGDKEELLNESLAVPVEVVLPNHAQTENGVVSEIHVYPKNTQEVPKIDKNFDKEPENAVKENELQGNNKDLEVQPGADTMGRDKPTATKKVGDTVPYKVETVIPMGAEYEKLVWTDTMSKGLTYNKDLNVTLNDTPLESSNYSIIATDRGFTLRLNQTGSNAVRDAAKEKDATITLKYTARVNQNAIPDEVDVNDVALDYSNKPGKESEPKEGKPVNKEIKVKKDWAVDGQNTITEADKNVKALFTLQEQQDDGSWKDVDSYEATIAEHFEHPFTGLDNNKTYRVVEQVSGYEPEYVSFENGVVQIKNDKDTTNPKTLNPSEPKVVTGGRRFVKVNENDERLAGASFYVKNSAGQYLLRKESTTNNVDALRKELNEAKEAYNNMTAEQQESEAGKTAKQRFDNAQKALNDAILNDSIYTWAAAPDENAVILVSNKDGQFEVTGLAYANNYELEEITAPDGYAKLTNNPKFNVEKGSYASSAAKTELQYNRADTENGYGLKVVNKNLTIPQTGGIGSLIFIVAGLALMGVAFVAMKRRNSYEEA